jgi:glycosyltransferase involved in cell wall biosynthesis
LNTKKKIKILYFIQLPPPIHGVSIINKQIYQSAYINKDIQTSLLEIKFSNKLNELRRLNLSKIIRFFSLIIKLIKSLKYSRPELIYFSLMPVGKGLIRDLFFVLVIKRFRITPIYHIHNKGIAQNSKTWVGRKLYHFIFRNSYIIHLSQSLYESEIAPLNLHEVKYRIIPNGIRQREEVNLNKSFQGINLLYLSNLFPQKGIFNLILIFKNIEYRFPDVKLSVVGGFPYRRTEKTILKLINKYNFGEKVILKGPKYGKNKVLEYSEADIFVFPTSFSQECFPLVILEAMQAGLPIITTDEGAISEIIEDGINGVVLKNWTIESFSEKLAELILNPELRLKLGKNARNKFHNNFTLQHLEKNMREFYEREFLS